jgi:holin-like protein
MATNIDSAFVAGLPNRIVRMAPARLTEPAQLAAQAALLSVIYLLSSALVDTLHLAVPSNLLALLLLLGMLATGLLRPSHIEQLASFLLRHLTFFFVPFTVGLLAYGPLLANAGAILAASLVVAAAVGITVAGLAAQAVCHWRGAPHADDR